MERPVVPNAGGLVVTTDGRTYPGDGPFIV